jgi:hypothetical protein
MESLIKIKKGFVIILGLMLVSNLSFGQTWEEFFKQRNTQLKYSIQQIAALKAYAIVAKKGYDIVSSGLNTVRDITNGEFKLHTVFIDALKTVSPIIRKDVRIAETIALHLEIKTAFTQTKVDGRLSSSNQEYIAEVRAKVFDECNKDLDELLQVITSGSLEMSDDERLKRLDIIYQSAKDKAQFVESFTTQVSLLNRQRELEESSNAKMREYYEK